MCYSDLSDLCPMENYTPPSLPTLAEGKPKQLAKLPVRWQKNAAVIACAGIMGFSFLTGCVPQNTSNTPATGIAPTLTHMLSDFSNYEYALDIRAHFGGSGAGPVYVAHLTEQEVIGIVRTQMRNVGVYMETAPPYSVEVPSDPNSLMYDHEHITHTVALNLFDADKRIGLAFNSTPSEQGWHNFAWVDESAVSPTFMAQHNILADLIRPHGHTVLDTWGWWNDSDEDSPPTFDGLTDEEEQEVRKILHAQLGRQLQAFVNRLHADGIPLSD